MRPIFTTVGDEVDVMIIPDTKIELDGHPVLTHGYHIYKDRFGGSGKYADKSADTPEKRNHDTDYLGVIRYEVPGVVFRYEPGGVSGLGPEDLKEVIEIINHYRDTPGLWVTD